MKVLVIVIASFFIVSCAQNNNKQKELELREREVALKEKELALKEKHIPLDNANNLKTVDNETLDLNKDKLLTKVKNNDKPIEIKRLIAKKISTDFKNIKQLCSVDEIVKKIHIKSILLNPNGKQYIVELWGCNGTDDCADNWIYELKNNDLILLGDLGCGSFNPAKALTVKTNGYFNFEISEVHGGTNTIYTSYYKFNGSDYKQTSFTEKPYNN